MEDNIGSWHDEVLVALARLETKVDGQNARLDKINGTVADYNANKFKIDETRLKVQSIETQTVKTAEITAERLLLKKELEHEKEHKKICEEIEEKYVDKKSLSIAWKTVIGTGTILAIIISASTVLQLLKII